MIGLKETVNFVSSESQYSLSWSREKFSDSGHSRNVTVQAWVV